MARLSCGFPVTLPLLQNTVVTVHKIIRSCRMGTKRNLWLLRRHLPSLTRAVARHLAQGLILGRPKEQGINSGGVVVKICSNR